jgi:hypothetical protein
MAKKSRRARRETARAAQPVRVTHPVRPRATQAVAKEVDFSEEYSYVIEDLKRIGLIALALLVLLVVLALLIA